MILRRLLAVSGIVVLTLVASALASDADEGIPFGKTTDRDWERLLATAKTHGVDLEASYKNAEAGDQESLGRIFSLASRFTKLDRVTRTYGNLMFSCFLNLVEAHGEKFF